MQKHTSAYYGLMLIGLIYSIPSAPMAYRAWSAKPATTAPRTYATRNSYSKQAALSKIENQPPKQSWWDWFRGRRVEGPATITSPITQPYVVPQAEVPVQPLSTTAQRKPTATRKKPASAKRKPVVKSPVVKSPIVSTALESPAPSVLPEVSPTQKSWQSWGQSWLAHKEARDKLSKKEYETMGKERHERYEAQMRLMDKGRKFREDAIGAKEAAEAQRAMKNDLRTNLANQPQRPFSSRSDTSAYEERKRTEYERMREANKEMPFSIEEQLMDRPERIWLQERAGPRAKK